MLRAHFLLSRTMLVICCTYLIQETANKNARYFALSSLEVQEVKYHFSLMFRDWDMNTIFFHSYIHEWSIVTCKYQKMTMSQSRNLKSKWLKIICFLQPVKFQNTKVQKLFSFLSNIFDFQTPKISPLFQFSLGCPVLSSGLCII